MDRSDHYRAEGGEPVGSRWPTRRQWLALCAGTTASLAGCLGDDEEPGDDEPEEPGDGRDDEEDEPGDDHDEDEDGEEEARERYDEAVSELVANAETLDRLTAEDTDPTGSDVDGIERRLEDAEAALDEADEAADDALEAELDAARDVVALQQALARYYREVVGFENTLETGLAYWETLELDRATEEFEQAQDDVWEAIDRLEAARDVHAEMTHGVVEAERLDYSGEFWEHVNPDSVAEVEVLEEFLVGLQQFTTTLDLTLDGFDAFEQEEYAQASERFESAEDEVDATLGTFREIEDDPETPDEFRPDVIELRGEVEAWQEALDYYAAAASAGEEGEFQEAEELFRAGNEALPD